MGNGLGIIDEEALNVFVDGSSFPNKKMAAGVGHCFVWVNDLGNEEIESYAPPGWQSATIDEMEIKACTVALNDAKRFFPDMKPFRRILIFSDSRYVVDNYFKAINIWPKTRWLGSNKMPVENIELWKELGRAVRNCAIRVDIEWVKAHKSNIHNRAADKLARESASTPVNKPLSVRATTKKWSDRQTKRGCISMLGQITKIRVVSREYVSKAKTNEYRYEVIDPEDNFYKDLDFVYCDTNLSRNKCYQVRFNDDQKKPYIDEVICELVCAEYKY